AITMAIAVLFSSFVALSLAPAICSRLLSRAHLENRMASAVDRLSLGMERRYRELLEPVLRRPWLVLLVVPACVAAAVLLFREVPQEYAPEQDRGILFAAVIAPEGSSFEYTVRQVEEIERRLMPLVDSGDLKRLLIRAPAFYAGESYNQGFVLMVMPDWGGDRRSTWDILADARRRVADLPGARVFIRGPSGLGGSSEDPVQFVVGGDSYEDLAAWQDMLLAEIATYPGLVGVDTDLRPTKPQLRVTIDRNRAGDLGVSLLEIGRTLETLLGSRSVTTFLRGGREYDVIIEGERQTQRTLTDLDTIYVRSDTSGQLIPLGNLVSVHELGDAGTLNRYNRTRSLTISAALADGYRLGDALDYLETLVRDKLPETATVDFKGESLEYRNAGQSAAFVFLLALLVVYLVMAAQFESFIHPFIILLTVPLALIGGLGGLLLFDQALNIYSQVGLIMLVGLATKNGILIVEFINQLRDGGMALEEAVVQGAARRLRPIAMTAFTTVVGAIPLVISSGPGYEVRTVIGVVVMCGVTVATLVTLVLIPMAYLLLARNTGSPGAVSRELDRELAAQPEPFD
ncbi:MAG: efflux RND transporter permease subunit, partial [Parahaliea sp.]